MAILGKVLTVINLILVRIQSHTPFKQALNYTRHIYLPLRKALDLVIVSRHIKGSISDSKLIIMESSANR